MRRPVSILFAFMLLSVVLAPVARAENGDPEAANEADNSAPQRVVPTVDELFPEAPPAPVKSVPSRADIRADIIKLDGIVRDVDALRSELKDIEGRLVVSEANLVQARSDRDGRVDFVLAEEEQRLGELKVSKEEKEKDLDVSRRKVGKLSLDLYMLGPEALVSIGSDDVLGEYRVNQTLRISVSNLKQEVADKQQIVDLAQTEIDNQEVRVAEAAAAVSEANSAVDRYTSEVEEGRGAAAKKKDDLFIKVAEGSSAQATVGASLKEVGSPVSLAKDPLVAIMGEPVLTTEQLTAWFSDTRGSLLVGENNVAELALLYVEEGKALGVRGDIAFIQAVLETGNFKFTGQNNFAGIGHCDSCPRGYPFATPREGVRAQIQLLRSYADKNLRSADLAGGPMPGINPDKLGVRGCCYSWWGLSGVWASALHYGGSMLTIYESAVTHSVRQSLLLSAQQSRP